MALDDETLDLSRDQSDAGDSDAELDEALASAALEEQLNA